MSETETAVAETPAADPAPPGGPGMPQTQAVAGIPMMVADDTGALVLPGPTQLGLVGGDNCWRRRSLVVSLLAIDMHPTEALRQAQAWTEWAAGGTTELARDFRGDLANAAVSRAPTARFNPAEAALLAEVADWCAAAS